MPRALGLSFRQLNGALSVNGSLVAKSSSQLGNKQGGWGNTAQLSLSTTTDCQPLLRTDFPRGIEGDIKRSILS